MRRIDRMRWSPQAASFPAGLRNPQVRGLVRPVLMVVYRWVWP